MTFFLFSLCAGAAITGGIRAYFAVKKILAHRKLEKIAVSEKKGVYDVLFFGEPGIGCGKHLYNKQLCYNMDCPYRRLRFMTETLDSCRKSLDICIHLLTASDIANCLINAHQRGVRVRVICDNEMSTNKGSQIRNLFNTGVPVKIPLLNYHMHNKIAIIDGWKIMTGSANWTVQGIYGNWDNLVITSHPDLVRGNIKYFELIWNHPEVHMYC